MSVSNQVFKDVVKPYLSPSTYLKFCSNIDTLGQCNGTPIHTISEPSAAVLYAFPWEDAPEDDDYWYIVYNGLKIGESIPVSRGPRLRNSNTKG